MVERDPGDVARLGAGLTHRSDRWQMSGRYGFAAEGPDHVADGGGRLPALEANTAKQVHEVGGGVRYSRVDAFLRGRAPFPIELDVDLARTFSAAPEAQMTIATVTASLFFGARD